MQFDNRTALDDARLRGMLERHSAPYRHDQLTVRVRYTRSTDFSGACFYRDSRIHVNLGRHNCYPYALATHVARAKSDRRFWWRELLRLEIADAYQLALFIYLHELYHHLVKSSGRCPRRKEAMCDRFAARVLVDGYGAALRTPDGRSASRADWDFQNLERFVAAAPRDPAAVA